MKKIFRKIKKKFYIKNFDGLNIRQIDEVVINPVLRCNLKCVMCHQGEIKCHKDMSFDKFEKILTNLKMSGVTKVSLIGGEIFVMEDIWRYIKKLEEMNFKYDLSSNLFYVPELEKLRYLKGLEMITTSIDGDLETHNKIRGNPMAFQNATKNIKRLLSMGIVVDVACVVQKANINILEKVASIAFELGIKRMTFLVANKITLEEKKAAISEIENLTGADVNFYVSTKENILGNLNESDYAKIPSKIMTIKNIARICGAHVHFSVQLENPSLLNKKFPLRDFTCSLFSGYGSYVYEDGSFNTCAFTKLSGEKFDISKHKPLKILNSGEYYKIRKRFYDYGAAEKCRYCCALRRK